MIELDVAAGRLHLEVDDAEIAARLAALVFVEPKMSGYEGLFRVSVNQADTGCDFRFLQGRRGATVAPDYV